MQKKTIQITEVCSTILEAIEKSGMDISYNPGTAKQQARMLMKDKRTLEVRKVFICDDGKIRYTGQCYDGLMVLNEFKPFSSCISNSDFVPVIIDENTNQIEFHHDKAIPKSHRESLIHFELMVS